MWHLTYVRLLTEPIPCQGYMGMWKLPHIIAEGLNALPQ